MQLLPGSKRQKCLHITSEIENEVVTSTTIHPLIPFKREEEQMAQIMKLNLVDVANNEGEEDTDDIAVAGKGDDDDKEKSIRHQALEKLQKAYAELTQLVALTENVHTQEHLVLLTKTMKAGLGLKQKQQDSTVLQRMCIVQQTFVRAQKPLQSEHQRMASLVHHRQAFASSLQCLGRVWRLRIQTAKTSLVGKKSKHARSAIGVDCR
jgi:hypothetical protein